METIRFLIKNREHPNNLNGKLFILAKGITEYSIVREISTKHKSKTKYTFEYRRLFQ